MSMRVLTVLALCLALGGLAHPQPPPQRPQHEPTEGPYVHRVESATSRDGLTFTADHRRLLEHASVPATIALPDGRLRIYFVDASSLPESANVAESADGGKSFRKLRLSIASIQGRALDPSIVRLEDGRWRLYYYYAAIGAPPDDGGQHEIRSAISVDGVHFAQEGVVFRHAGLVDPDVWWNGKEWLMYVFSHTERTTVYARSWDGLHFTYGGPIETLRGFGTVAPVALGDGRFRLYAFEQGQQRNVRSFISGDGYAWTQESGIRFSVPPGQQVTDPFVVGLKDGSWRMFFKTHEDVTRTGR